MCSFHFLTLNLEYSSALSLSEFGSAFCFLSSAICWIYLLLYLFGFAVTDYENISLDYAAWFMFYV
jgi:hypothetical protein